jgi:hypothetical protein
MCCAVGAAAAFSPAGHAAIVWGGPPITFTKPNFVDYTLPQYQDHITDDVWITRANAGGIFNIAAESGYNNLAPAGTEWATGTTADWQSLTFEPWVQWNNQQPLGVINVDAVLHLIGSDIYIDIKFLSWTCCANGGGFSYIRSTLPAPSALGALILGALVPSRSRARRAR